MLKRLFIPKRCLFHGSKSILVPKMTLGESSSHQKVNIGTKMASRMSPFPALVPRDPPPDTPPDPPRVASGGTTEGSATPLQHDWQPKRDVQALATARRNASCKRWRLQGETRRASVGDCEVKRGVNLSHTPTGRRIKCVYFCCGPHILT